MFRRRSSSRARGNVLAYTIIALIAIMGIVSLAADLGLVMLAKSELQDAADAAARYAVAGLDDGTATSKAVTSASENRVTGSGLVLQTSDVRLGRWDSDTRTFVANGTPTDAVEVTARRTATRGTAVRLLFAQVIGKSSIDLTAQSIAIRADSGAVGFVGLDFVTMNSASVNSYRSSAGAYTAAKARPYGHVAGNGAINLNSTAVQGRLFMLSGQSLTTNSSTHNGRTALNSPLSMSAAATMSHSGNLNLSGTSMSIPGGTYSYNQVNLDSATIYINGPTTLYVRGNVNINSSSIIVTSGKASDLVILARDNGAFTLNSTLMTADVYAPGRNVNVNSASDFRGRIVGLTLDVNSSQLHYDESLTALSGVNAASSTSSVQLVR